MTRPTADDLDGIILDDALEDARMRRAEAFADDLAAGMFDSPRPWMPPEPTDDKHEQRARSWRDPAFLVGLALGLAVLALALLAGGARAGDG